MNYLFFLVYLCCSSYLFCVNNAKPTTTCNADQIQIANNKAGSLEFNFQRVQIITGFNIKNEFSEFKIQYADDELEKEDRVFRDFKTAQGLTQYFFIEDSQKWNFSYHFTNPIIAKVRILCSVGPPRGLGVQ